MGHYKLSSPWSTNRYAYTQATELLTEPWESNVNIPDSTEILLTEPEDTEPAVTDRPATAHPLTEPIVIVTDAPVLDIITLPLG